MLGNTPSIFSVSWPSYDKDVIIAEQVEMVIQINSKVRSRIVVSSDINEDDLRALIMEDKRVKEYLNGKNVLKTIVVPKKLVNLVVR